MYCPACDKEFSPVHSRCPECKGWLRVSGPTVGAKAVAAPAIRAATPAGVGLDTATTQKVQPITGANVPLPSRPRPAATAQQNSEAPSLPRPTPTLQTATEPVDQAGRGGLGTGWEASSSFSAPASPAPAGGGWGTPAPAGPATSWGAPANGLGAGPTSWPAAETPKPTGWGAPAAAPPASMAGLGGGMSHGLGAAPVGLGAPPSAAPGFGAPPPGSLGAPTGSLGPAPGSAVGSTGGGWLGDGSGGSSAYTPPSSRSGGWLGDAQEGPAPTPISMPSMAPPELSKSHDAPALSLPDHTVAVDLGTPWEEEAQAAQSNKMVYVVLACLVLSLSGFFGFVWWQKQKLKTPTQPGTPGEPAPTALGPGLQNLKEAKAAYQNRKWDEAQAKAETAFLLLGELKVAKPQDRNAAVSFYRQASVRYGQALYEEAERHFRNGRTTQALGSCDQAVSMYAKIAGTSKEQARARALEARICESIGDSAGAVSAYRKADDLNPGAGYKSAANRVRAASAPQTTAPTPAEPEAPEVEPSLGDPTNYPGRSPGHYTPRGTSSTPPPAVPAGPAPKPRPPQPVFVGKKKDDTPSWRKRGSDVLPSYNKR